MNKGSTDGAQPKASAFPQPRPSASQTPQPADFALFGFEDKDDARRKENEGIGSDAIEVKARSCQLMDSFAPVWLFLTALGRFPYERNLTKDGTVQLRFRWNSANTIAFIVSSALAIILFLWFTFGIFSGFIIAIDKSDYTDICGQTWELSKFREGSAALLLTWTWLAMLTISSILGLTHFRDLEKYLNYWNRSVQAMDINVDYLIRYFGIRDNIIFFVIVLVYIVLYGSGFSEGLQSAVFMTANSMIRFYVTDYFILETTGHMNESTYRKLRNAWSPSSSTPPTPDPFIKSTSEILFDILGLLVIIIGMYGNRCFVVLFLFCCQILRNATWVWNERFRNHLHREKPDPADQTRRRIDHGYLIKDHLILVQIFKLTESNFTVVLQVFYLSQVTLVILILLDVIFEVLHLIWILYCFTLITTASNCHEWWDLAFTFKCTEFDSDFSMTSGKFMTNPKIVTFESPYRDGHLARLQHIIFMSLLFFQVIYALFETTLAGASAYEEAMRGWQILRRHSFMTTTNNRERNFIHSLIISFARNNPLQISAGGYFGVNKALLVTIIINALIYFTIMLQFRPGELNPGRVCNNSGILDIYSPEGITR